MEKIIEVKICTGTTCYIMGASDILVLEDHIPVEIKESVDISGSACLGLCRYDASLEKEGVIKRYKPPFVLVCGRLIEKATLEKVLDAVKAEFNGEEYAYAE